jgi:hypothetical protein
MSIRSAYSPPTGYNSMLFGPRPMIVFPLTGTNAEVIPRIAILRCAQDDNAGHPEDSDPSLRSG